MASFCNVNHAVDSYHLPKLLILTQLQEKLSKLSPQVLWLWLVKGKSSGNSSSLHVSISSNIIAR